MSRFSHIRALGGVALLTLGLCVAPRAAAPEGAVPLSLEDALKTALQNNFDIKVDQVTLQQADQSLKGSYGIYDTQLNFTWYNNVNRVPATSRLDVGDITATYMNRTDAYNLGVTQPTPWGQSFQLVWNNNRDLTNSLYSYLNPTYNSSATLGTTLPLLQGFGKTVASRTVLLAKLGKDIAGSAYIQNVRDSLLQVEKDYFQLVYDVKDLETREAALDLAKRFQEETRKRIEVGVLAPIEQVTADAQVATREQDIITARQAVGNSMDILRLDLGVPKESDEWNRPIHPTDEPKLISNEKTEAELVDQALARRPEVAQLRGKLEQDKINLAVAKNAALPQLNLVASVTYNGASGTYTDPVTGQVLYDHAFSKAWSQITGTDFKSYYVGAGLLLPDPEPRRQGPAAELAPGQNRRRDRYGEAQALHRQRGARRTAGPGSGQEARERGGAHLPPAEGEARGRAEEVRQRPLHGLQRAVLPERPTRRRHEPAQRQGLHPGRGRQAGAGHRHLPREPGHRTEVKCEG